MLNERTIRLEVLSRQLTAEQGARARRAVIDERMRIAQELHDVVAHHMSVISIQASLAGYVFTSDPGTARAALRTVEETSHEALEETRRLLAVLRPEAEGADGDAPHAPAPGLDRVTEVVDRVRAAGVPVQLSVTGQQRPLPPGIELCAYRVVQEALTNVLRHARPATATVRVEYRSRHLSVQVIDDGPARPAGPYPSPTGQSPTCRSLIGQSPTSRSLTGQSPTGQGLNGMRERARLYGGSLSAGPGTHGGFEVQLMLRCR